MMDPRVEKLANNLLTHSVAVKPGEKVLIDVNGVELPLAKALIHRTYDLGGLPYVQLTHDELHRQWLLGVTADQLEDMLHWETQRMDAMDCYIGIRSKTNSAQESDVPAERQSLYEEVYWHILHLDHRIKGTRWVVLRYPNASMAQNANMSTDAFEDFYFNVCNLDYRRMREAMEPLVKVMEQTDHVHIKGPQTDLQFSIKNIPVVPCYGQSNIPDGECYTAPVKDSVNGVITFNTSSRYMGFRFENVRLEFEHGRIVKATANDTDRINRIFDTDAGARYVGEFSLGFNPYVLHPLHDTLFDEKIAGSFHFTPGNSYDDAYNGNNSAIHWDMVSIQRPEYGGGEIWFDDRLIRKDGQFVVPELEGLNPERLK